MRKQAFTAALLVAMIAAPTSARAQDVPPPATSFEKVTLDDFPGEPMNLAVLPDGRVLHTTRAGEVRIHNPRTGLNTLAATLDVYQHDEEGLQSVAIDPNFETNRWVYVVLLAAAEHAGRRPDDAGDQRGRRARDRHRRRTSRRSRARIRLSALQARAATSST